MIRASALSYAIVFVLLIGLICSSLLFINATQKKIEFHFTTDEHLLLDSYAALQYGTTHLAVGDSSLLVHPFGDSSKIHSIQWGAATVITTETFRGNKVKKRAAIIGFPATDKTCLYLPGNQGSLKIAGNTTLEGEITIPNKQIETAYLSGKPYIKPSMYSGDLNTAENQLPELQKAFINLNHTHFTKGLNPSKYVAKDSIYSFSSKTVYYQSTASIVIDNSLRGNVIIHSFDSIFITKTAQLENVILIAPKISFQDGFKGSVQAFAYESIVLGKEVQLTYPSYLMLNETELKNPNAQRNITLSERSLIIGGILITTQAYDYRYPPSLVIGPECTIGGMIYNLGVSELAGTILGSVYTQSLRLRYGGGEYTNHLLDVLLSSRRLPVDFCYPGWLKSKGNPSAKIISWL